MARHWYGQSLVDWTMTMGTPVESEGVRYAQVSAAGPIPITFWTESSGGLQHTDLLNASGVAVEQIMTADGLESLALGTAPRFRGPDDVTEMWADAGGGARYLMVATDLGAHVKDLRTRLTTLEDTVELLTNSLGALVYDGGWPSRPGDDRPYAWIGPSAPTGSDGDLWFNTAP